MRNSFLSRNSRGSGLRGHRLVVGVGLALVVSERRDRLPQASSTGTHHLLLLRQIQGGELRVINKDAGQKCARTKPFCNGTSRVCPAAGAKGATGAVGPVGATGEVGPVGATGEVGGWCHRCGRPDWCHRRGRPLGATGRLVPPVIGPVGATARSAIGATGAVVIGPRATLVPPARSTQPVRLEPLVRRPSRSQRATLVPLVPAGPAGGATGATGATGLPGVSGRQMVGNGPVSLPHGKRTQLLIAACPADKTAIGGESHHLGLPDICLTRPTLTTTLGTGPWVSNQGVDAIQFTAHARSVSQPTSQKPGSVGARLLMSSPTTLDSPSRRYDSSEP